MSEMNRNVLIDFMLLTLGIWSTVVLLTNNDWLVIIPTVVLSGGSLMFFCLRLYRVK